MNEWLFWEKELFTSRLEKSRGNGNFPEFLFRDNNYPEENPLGNIGSIINPKIDKLMGNVLCIHVHNHACVCTCNDSQIQTLHEISVVTHV